jgi:hypothetical protein
VLEVNLFEVNLQLFGDQHRDRRIGALTHFDVRHGQDDPAVACDAHEGVGREGVVVGRFEVAGCERQLETQHQASARCGSGPKKVAPRERVRRKQCRPAGTSGRVVINGHGCLPFSRPQPA